MTYLIMVINDTAATMGHLRDADQLTGFSTSFSAKLTILGSFSSSSSTSILSATSAAAAAMTLGYFWQNQNTIRRALVLEGRLGSYGKCKAGVESTKDAVVV